MNTTSLFILRYGVPVERVIVKAENTERPTRLVPQAETNRDGEFSIAGLVPGQYELYTHKEEDGYPRTEFDLYDVGLLIRELQFTRGRLLKE